MLAIAAFCLCFRPERKVEIKSPRLVLQCNQCVLSKVGRTIQMFLRHVVQTVAGKKNNPKVDKFLEDLCLNNMSLAN